MANTQAEQAWRDGEEGGDALFEALEEEVARRASRRLSGAQVSPILGDDELALMLREADLEPFFASRPSDPVNSVLSSLADKIVTNAVSGAHAELYGGDAEDSSAQATALSNYGLSEAEQAEQEDDDGVDGDNDDDLSSEIEVELLRRTSRRMSGSSLSPIALDSHFDEDFRLAEDQLYEHAQTHSVPVISMAHQLIDRILDATVERAEAYRRSSTALPAHAHTAVGHAQGQESESFRFIREEAYDDLSTAARQICHEMASNLVQRVVRDGLEMALSCNQLRTSKASIDIQSSANAVEFETDHESSNEEDDYIEISPGGHVEAAVDIPQSAAVAVRAGSPPTQVDLFQAADEAESQVTTPADRTSNTGTASSRTGVDALDDSNSHQAKLVKQLQRQVEHFRDVSSTWEQRALSAEKEALQLREALEATERELVDARVDRDKVHKQKEGVCKVNDDLLQRLKAQQALVQEGKAQMAQLESKLLDKYHEKEQELISELEALQAKHDSANERVTMADQQVRAMQAEKNAAEAAARRSDEQRARTELLLEQEREERERFSHRVAETLAEANQARQELEALKAEMERQQQVMQEREEAHVQARLEAEMRAEEQRERAEDALDQLADKSKELKELLGKADDDALDELVQLRLRVRLHDKEVERFQIKLADKDARLKGVQAELKRLVAREALAADQSARIAKLESELATARGMIQIYEEEAKTISKQANKDRSMRLETEGRAAGLEYELKQAKDELQKAQHELDQLMASSKGSSGYMSAQSWTTASSSTVPAYPSTYGASAPFKLGSLTGPPPGWSFEEALGQSFAPAASGAATSAVGQASEELNAARELRIAQQRLRDSEKREKQLLDKLAMYEHQAEEQRLKGGGADTIAFSVHQRLLAIAEEARHRAEDRCSELEAEASTLRVENADLQDLLAAAQASARHSSLLAGSLQKEVDSSHCVRSRTDPSSRSLSPSSARRPVTTSSRRDRPIPNPSKPKSVATTSSVSQQQSEHSHHSSSSNTQTQTRRDDTSSAERPAAESSRSPSSPKSPKTGNLSPTSPLTRSDSKARRRAQEIESQMNASADNKASPVKPKPGRLQVNLLARIEKSLPAGQAMSAADVMRAVRARKGASQADDSSDTASFSSSSDDEVEGTRKESEHDLPQPSADPWATSPAPSTLNHFIRAKGPQRRPPRRRVASAGTQHQDKFGDDSTQSVAHESSSKTETDIVAESQTKPSVKKKPPPPLRPKPKSRPTSIIVDELAEAAATTDA